MYYVSTKKKRLRENTIIGRNYDLECNGDDLAPFLFCALFVLRPFCSAPFLLCALFPCALFPCALFVLRPYCPRPFCSAPFLLCALFPCALFVLRPYCPHPFCCAQMSWIDCRSVLKH